MKYRNSFLLISVLLLSTLGAVSTKSQDISFGGYLQGLPIRLSAELPPPVGDEIFWEYRMQNRLNVTWYISDEFQVTGQARTRLFAGDLVNQVPGYTRSISRDDGILNLSWMIAESDHAFLHFMPDRLYGEWSSGDWNIRAGRQRINWGVNMVTNPNDLFNIYSFFEFDYPERPGSDGIRIQYHLDWASRIEFAAAPKQDMRESVAALMYVFQLRGYDVQVISGYYQNRLALGGGWAGSISTTGFKGEVMFFHDAEANPDGERKSALVAAVSADHMFDNGVFLVAESAWNSAGGGMIAEIAGESLSADNPTISEFQFTTQASYSLNPLLDGSLAAIWFPDENGVYLSPSITYSLTQNTDIMLLAQYFAGSSDSNLANAGTLIAGSVKWNF